MWDFVAQIVKDLVVKLKSLWYNDDVNNVGCRPGLQKTDFLPVQTDF